jgi:TetR/AcrR family transcriptional regulator, transcriptional repressor of aconitase
MAARITEQDADARRASILQAARWCFLNFGFAKTSLDDIAKRTGISRTLLYRTFKDKEDIFSAVFADWLIARHPLAQAAATAEGDPFERLLTMCQVMVVEPWKDMVGAPMSGEFYDVCERIDPAISEQHYSVFLECVRALLPEDGAAEVFLLSLEGLLTDEPSVAALENRVRILAARFIRPDAEAERT